MGARSSSGELRSPFVGASEFLILIMNSEDAQLLAPPRQLRLQNSVFSGEASPNGAWAVLAGMCSQGFFGGAAEQEQTQMTLCGEAEQEQTQTTLCGEGGAGLTCLRRLKGLSPIGGNLSSGCASAKAPLCKGSCHRR